MSISDCGFIFHLCLHKQIGMEVTQNGRSGVPVINHALAARPGETELARIQLEKETAWIAQLSVLLLRQESVMPSPVHVRTTSILKFIHI